VIANALDLVDHKLKASGIDVEYRRHRSAIAVTGNPVHLEQVLINLIANAADAMEHSPIRVLSIGVKSGARSVEIAVSDTGSGIAPDELSNLFDPFYSTKQAGRGLGLGLSISYGLVRDIGGAITVDSRPGKGSTFTVRLPLAHSGVGEAAAPALPSPLRGGIEGGGPSATHETTPSPALPSRGRGRKTQLS